MALAPRDVDRWAVRLFYVGICGMVLWAGTALINHSLEVKFYKDYLWKWELAGRRYQAKGALWPVFTGNNHAQYMRELVRKMKRRGIYPPHSNTNEPYTYIIDRIWQTQERIFVLLLPQAMVVYGMSPRTYRVVDGYVDGTVDLNSGEFKGKRSKDGSSIIGRWGL